MIRIAELLRGKEGSVLGWVRSVRKYKSHAFVVIDDGGPQTLQIVVDSPPAGCITGASVSASGDLRSAPNGSLELHPTEFKLIGESSGDYPLGKKSHSMDHLRENLHLRARTATIASILRVRSEIWFSIHEFFRNQDFYYIHTPIITGNDWEGAGELFEVNPKSFFGIPAYLTVSGQLQAEIFACAMSRVYTFGPTFRAEMSHTSRHLAEFWMIEPEVVGYDLDDTCSLAEDLIKHVAKSTIDRCPRELEGFKTGDLVDSLASSSPWERVAFDSVSEGQEKLTTEREKELAAKNGPMFVTHYPEHTMPFYMKRSGSNTLNFDLLLPEMGEVVGGSVREEDHDLLANRIADNGIKGLDWYLALRKYGTVPHAGFGLGLERLVSYITGQSNVKDVIPVPRTHSSLQL